MDFIYLLRVLLKRKWIILSAALLAGILAWYFTRNESKKYRSSAQISTGYAIKDRGIMNEDFDPFAADTKFNNAVVQFTSEPVLNLLSYDLILHDLQSKNPFRRLSETQKKSSAFQDVNLNEARLAFQQRRESMQLLTSFNPEERKLLNFLKLFGYDYKSINTTLSVGRLQHTDFLQVDFLSENPELSAFIVNDLFQNFLRYTNSIMKEKSTESIDTLKSVRDRKKQELDIKNAMLSKYGVVEDGVSTSTMDVAGNLRTQMQEEKSKKTQKEYELKRVIQKLNALAQTSGQNEHVVNNDELLQAQKAAAEARIEADNDPGNKAKQDNYTRLNNIYQTLRLEASAGKSTGNETVKESKAELLDKKADLENDIQRYTSSITDYERQIGMLEGQVTNLSSREATVETLKKERDLANKEFLDAQQRYNEATDRNTSAGSNFRQTIAGQPAIDPEPSKRALLIAMAGGAALITTLLVIIVFTYLDSSVKTPIIFSKAVNLKLISLINFMDLKNKKLEEVLSNKNNDNGNDRNNFNAFRESIRKLRYEIERTDKKNFFVYQYKKGPG